MTGMMRAEGTRCPENSTHVMIAVHIDENIHYNEISFNVMAIIRIVKRSTALRIGAQAPSECEHEHNEGLL